MTAASLTVATFFSPLYVNILSGQDAASWSHPIPFLLAPPPPALLIICDSSAQKCHHGILTPHPAASTFHQVFVCVEPVHRLFFFYFLIFIAPVAMPSLCWDWRAHNDTIWHICTFLFHCLIFLRCGKSQATLFSVIGRVAYANPRLCSFLGRDVLSVWNGGIFCLPTVTPLSHSDCCVTTVPSLVEGVLCKRCRLHLLTNIWDVSGYS